MTLQQEVIKPCHLPSLYHQTYGMLIPQVVTKYISAMIMVLIGTQ